MLPRDGVQLHGTIDGENLLTSGRDLFVGDGDTLEYRGTIPLPNGFNIRKHLRCGVGYEALARIVGRYSVVTVEPLTTDRFLATSHTGLFISEDGGRTWTQRATLARSSPPFGVLPTAIDYSDGAIRVGEYPQGDEPARLFESVDLGRTWISREFSGIRHIHAVTRDPFDGDLWITTGDADEECHIGRYRDGSFLPLGGGSQRWRAVDLAFTQSAILWGMDSGYATQKHIFKLDRSQLERPEPEPVEEVDSSVFFAATVHRDDESYVVFSTAAEPRLDSTAPPGRRRPGGSTAAVLISSTASAFKRWTVVARYRRRPVPVDHVPFGVTPAASAYVHLAAKNNTVLVNPQNTACGDGSVVEYTPAADRIRVLLDHSK